MSTNHSENETKQESISNPCHGVTSVIPARSKDLGGFSVRRLLPYVKQKMVGPWIFFDHLGPASFDEGQGIDVRPHPHINLATVTYLFSGEIFHRDSVGSSQKITPGAINLMVAGKGIVHSERTRAEIKAQKNEVEALQLWLALPEEDEEIEPNFYHYPSTEIPETEIAGVKVRIMIGTAYNITSPVKTFAKTLYLESHLKEQEILTLPEESIAEMAIYVLDGSIEINDYVINKYNMAILDKNIVKEIKALKKSKIAIIGGEKMGKRYIDWNFVSSRKERIEQAKQDWKNGNFAKVPGDEDEFIPLP